MKLLVLVCIYDVNPHIINELEYFNKVSIKSTCVRTILLQQ